MSVRPLLVFVLIVCAFPAVAAKPVVNGKIAFVSDRDGNEEIYVMNPDGSGQTRLTFDSDEDTDPAWSPDGRRIAFTKRQQIFVMNADGSGATQLTSQGFNENPAWSPDGLKIAFQSSRDSVALLEFEIYVMDADGENETRLTNLPEQNLQPAWSPDGKQIAFMCDSVGVNAGQNICIMDADGSGVLELTTGTRAFDGDPSFSPDGKKIVFSRGIFIEVRDRVMIMNADGSDQQRLALGVLSGGTFTPANHPVFSPDGKKIAFGSEPALNVDTRITLMNPDGSEETEIAHTPGAANEQPSWQRKFPTDTTGVYLPSSGKWLLRNSNTSGDADMVLTFGGQVKDLPVAGDWNGDGQTDVAIYRGGKFNRAILKTFTLCPTCPLLAVAEPLDSIAFGESGDFPVAGDWNGDGIDDLGVFRPGPQGTFLLRIPQAICPFCNPPLFIFETRTLFFGTVGAPVAGDWDGDGKDGVGVYDRASSTFFLSNDLAKSNFIIPFGKAGDLPLSGDWAGTGRDGIGVFQPSRTLMSLATEITAEPDIVFEFGDEEGLPVAGHWLAQLDVP